MGRSSISTYVTAIMPDRGEIPSLDFFCVYWWVCSSCFPSSSPNTPHRKAATSL